MIEGFVWSDLLLNLAICYQVVFIMFGERKVNIRFPRMQSNHVTYVPLAVHLLRSHKVRNKYQQSFEQHLSQFQCDAEGSVEDQWGY